MIPCPPQRLPSRLWRERGGADRAGHSPRRLRGANVGGDGGPRVGRPVATGDDRFAARPGRNACRRARPARAQRRSGRRHGGLPLPSRRMAPCNALEGERRPGAAGPARADPGGHLRREPRHGYRLVTRNRAVDSPGARLGPGYRAQSRHAAGQRAVVRQIVGDAMTVSATAGARRLVRSQQGAWLTPRVRSGVAVVVVKPGARAWD